MGLIGQLQQQLREAAAQQQQILMSAVAATCWGHKRPRSCLGRGAQQQLTMDQQQVQGAQHQLAVDQQQLLGAQQQLALDQQQLQGAQQQQAQALEQLQNSRTGLERSELLLRQHMNACMRAATMDLPSHADMQPCSHAAMHNHEQQCRTRRLTVERPTEIQSDHWHHHNVGIFVACAYFRNDRDEYREETVYVLTDGKDQSAAVTQAALHQVLDYLQAQFKGTPALQLHRRMAMRYKDEEVEQCAEPDPDAHRLLRTISGSRAMHAMFFPADGVAPMWSETACACVRHMGSKPQQCMCHGASTLSSIPMFGRVTLASDKEEDVQCLKLLHARAPHIASSYMTLTVHLLKEYARGCLGWKGKRLTQNKPLLRADILEHLRWEQEMEEDQLAEVGVDEADDM
ncbi:hypothetical protein QJQ45_024091 [Haematococcus lacustris]|nr:hypothetical protein QJQ45_024091 [Haematococcus lacustris]